MPATLLNHVRAGWDQAASTPAVATSGTITPGTNVLLVALLSVNCNSSNPFASTAPSSSGSGPDTWDLIGAGTIGATYTPVSAAWSVEIGGTDPGSFTVTVSFANVGTDTVEYLFSIYAIDDYDTADPIASFVQQDGMTGNGPITATLPVSVTTDQIALAQNLTDENTNSQRSIFDAAQSWTTDADGTGSGMKIAYNVGHRTGSTDSDCDWSDVNTGADTFGSTQIVVLVNTVSSGISEGSATGAISWVGSATGENFGQDPVSYVKEVGFVTNSTAGTTSTITVAAGGVPVDDHVVIYGACDNTGGGGAATTITVTDTRGNSYTTRTPQAIADPGSAAAGIQGFFAVAKITTALQAGDTITITYGNSTTAKGINAQQFHGVNLTTPVLASTYSVQDNQTGTTTSVSATATAAGQAVLALVAVEGGTADSFTQDSDTTNGSWVTLTRRGSGTTTAGATLNSVYKIVTAAGAQTYNPTLGTARDHCAAILVLDFEPIELPANEGSGDGAISWVGSATGATNKFGSANGAVSWVGTTTTGLFPFPASKSGGKWLDQNGQVYLMKAFSSWGMAQMLSDAEITTALEALVDNGFNAATICYGGSIDMGSGWHRYQNDALDDWWTGTPWASTFGPAWSSFDHAVSECLRLGLTINASNFVSWSSTGSAPAMATATNANLVDVGEELATRYPVASYPNIVWHVMFDTTDGPASTSGQRIKALFQGINNIEGSSARLRWVENGQNQTTDTAGWLDDTDLNASGNSLYSYNSNSVETVEGIYDDTNAVADFPFGDSEPPYDGATHYTGNMGQQLRERTYALFLLGAMYQNFGHENWWTFGASGLFSGDVAGGWPDVQAHDHVVQQSYIHALLDQYVRDLTWDRNAFIATGTSSGDAKAGSGASDTAAIAYIPTNRTLALNTTVLPGSAKVWIYHHDPFTGITTLISGAEDQNASRSIAMPSARGDGTSDAVYIVTFADIQNGEGNGSIAWVGSSTGVRIAKADGSGAISWVGSSTGTRISSGNASGAISWVGSSTGDAPDIGVNEGEATGAISWVSSATGSEPAKGSGDGAISWVGSSTGVRVPKASATGAISWIAVAIGGNLGIGLGSISWTGSATGVHLASGSGAGAISWIASADGFAPTPGINDGSAAGAISWVGSATGVRTPKGSASGNISWVGVVVGGNLGVGLGAISWVGSATGEAPGVDINDGEAIGSIGWSGTATGASVHAGAVIGAIVWIGIATSTFTVDPSTFLLPPHMSGYIPQIIVGHKPGIRS